MVKLNSVGSILDTKDGMVYPQNNDGTPDLNCGGYLEDSCDEWLDSLAPEKVMNQLMMMNSNGWNPSGETVDNYSYGADGIKSEYNINNAVDFYTNVVHRTMGGHLPMMLQINSDDTSPQNFAIVRLSGNSLQITQKTPNLYNIKLKLTEQI